jgi:hypothetical protein
MIVWLMKTYDIPPTEYEKAIEANREAGIVPWVPTI